MFKLGILDADIIREDLQDEYISYAHMMVQLFRQVMFEANSPYKDIEFQFYSVINGEYPRDINENDAYLITGSKSSAYDDDSWIIKLKKFIQILHDNDKKMLGICFGHQLIAHTLGGETKLSDKGWGVGVHSYQVTELAHEVAPSLKKEFSLLVSHRDQVSSLPNNAELIASSVFCENAAYCIPNKALCFQGHPEFVPKYADALMQARKDIIDKGTFEKAQGNLNDKTQHLDVARDMLGFVIK